MSDDGSRDGFRARIVSKFSCFFTHKWHLRSYRCTITIDGIFRGFVLLERVNLIVQKCIRISVSPRMSHHRILSKSKFLFIRDVILTFFSQEPKFSRNYSLKNILIFLGFPNTISGSRVQSRFQPYRFLTCLTLHTTRDGTSWVSGTDGT